ncbi:MAG: DNA polymerase III subunit gamma/tau [Bdellovibrionales bacterium]
MSYEVIARKWRSQSFDELVGQSHISQTLLNALKKDRLPHAMLFTGTRGVGKTSSARILAKALRCPNQVDFKPCNTCNECVDISKSSNVNVIEIDGASNNGVDAIRELRDSVGYMPASGKHKVYIIDEVHMLSTSAFNALLKTLEEPPSHVIFILATTEPQKIPITVHSRCQRFDFRRISTKEIQAHLKHICEKEEITFDAEALWTVARQADGSMRDSMSLLDQVISFSNGELVADKVFNVLGLTDRQILVDTLDALVNRNDDKIIEVIEKLHSSGTDPKQFAEDLIEEIRNLLFVKLETPKLEDIVDVPESEVELLRTHASLLSNEDIHMLFDMALKGGNDIPKSENPGIVLEMMLLRMTAAPKIAQIVGSPTVQKKNLNSESQRNETTKQQATASASSNNTENKTAQKETINTETRKIIPSTERDSKPNIRPDSSNIKVNNKLEPKAPYLEDLSLQENWNRAVQYGKSKQPMLMAKLEHCIPLNKSMDSMEFGFVKTKVFLKETLGERSLMDKILHWLNETWGTELSKMSFNGIDTPPENRNLSPKEYEAQQENLEQERIERSIEANPLVRASIEIFNAKIKDIQEMKK